MALFDDIKLGLLQAIDCEKRLAAIREQEFDEALTTPLDCQREKAE